MVKFGGTTLCNTRAKNLLGLYVDGHVSFKKHVDEISKKVMGALIYINMISSYLEKRSSIVVVQSLVLNLCNYCPSVWGTAPSPLIDKVQKL